MKQYIAKFKTQERSPKHSRLIFDVKNKKLAFNRSQSGKMDFSENFASKEIVAPLVQKKNYKVRLFVDRHSVEVFINDGEISQTNTVFPTSVYNSLEIKPKEGKISVENFVVHRLK